MSHVARIAKATAALVEAPRSSLELQYIAGVGEDRVLIWLDRLRQEGLIEPAGTVPRKGPGVRATRWRWKK